MAVMQTSKSHVLFRSSSCPSKLPDLSRDLADMSTIGATASAPDIDVREARSKVGHLAAEFLRVTIFEMPELAEIERFHCNGVWHEAP